MEWRNFGRYGKLDFAEKFLRYEDILKTFKLLFLFLHDILLHENILICEIW